jgi:hypothetical protein
MKPPVLILIGIVAYALFANQGGPAAAFTPTKQKKKKGSSTTTTPTKVTNISTAKAKKARALKEKRRAM